MVELMRKLSKKNAAQSTSSGTQSTLRQWTYQRHPPHQACFQASPGRKWPANRCDKFRLMNHLCSQDLARYGSNLEDHAANAAKTVDANLGCLGSHENSLTTKYLQKKYMYEPPPSTRIQTVLHLLKIMKCPDKKCQHSWDTMMQMAEGSKSISRWTVFGSIRLSINSSRPDKGVHPGLVVSRTKHNKNFGK